VATADANELSPRIGPDARIVRVDAAAPMLAVARSVDTTIDWRDGNAMSLPLELNEIAEKRVGTIVDSRHSFGNPEALKTLLEAAGFSDVRVETVSHDVRLPDGALYARLNAMAVIGMSEKGKGLNEAERVELAGRIAADSQDLVTRQTKEGAFIFPLVTNVAVARG
jgi:hypothetical protein